MGSGAMDYSASLSLNNNLCDMVSIEGKAIGNSSLKYKVNDVVATGVSGGATLTVFSNIVKVEEIPFVTGSPNVLVTGDGSGVAGNVDILIASNNDGTYDTSILHPSSITITNAPSNPLQYKSSVTLTASEPVTWSSDSAKVSVNRTTGEVKSVFSFLSKSGEAKITATSLDGKRTGSVTIQINPAWWQWIIIVALFGWLWY